MADNYAIGLAPRQGFDGEPKRRSHEVAPGVFADGVVLVPGAAASTSGASRSRVVSAATTNATSVKASAGKMLSLRLFNTAAAIRYLKLYDKASAPTVGTDTPVWTIPLPAGGGYSEQFLFGFEFSTGIAYAITGALADSDTTAVAANDVTGTMNWI